MRERWGVEPAQIADVLALMGDSIDNIPGVKGVGEKTAVKLIGQFGGVDGIYENLTLVGGKLRETLAASRKQALLSRELATVNRQRRPRLRSRGVPPRRSRLAEAAQPLDGDGVRPAREGAAGGARCEVSDAPVPHLATAADARAWLGEDPGGRRRSRSTGRASFVRRT